MSRSICPAALRGALRRSRWTTYMGKVDLAVWRRPARAVCEVLMTKFSCFALAAADMTHVSNKSNRGQLVFRSSLLYVWVTRGPFGRLTKSLCDFGDMTPHTLVGGAQTTLTARASVRADRRNDPREAWGPRGDTQSRPPEALDRCAGVTGWSQGPSGRPATRGIPPTRVYSSPAGKGLTRGRERSVKVT